MKILLVDDSITERHILTAYLTKLGHTPIIAENGLEAVKLFETEKPDLVLMDVIMPEMDGYQAARKIREENTTWIPIIFLSGRVDPEDIAEGIAAGGDDYLTKPVNLKILQAKMVAMQRIAKMRKKLVSVTEELETANVELKKLVNIDGLTGIANRRYLDKYLTVEISRAIRNHHPIAIIMCDVDHFKKFNDENGHIVGDDCLKSIAKTLDNVCQRKSDLVARYGGEEFAVVLPNTSIDDAKLVAETMRKKVESIEITDDSNNKKKITISLGVYSDNPNHTESIEILLAKADSALYNAKKDGRNKSLVFDNTL
ncbi:MAG: diguanylate cyclase response regulator [Kangiella sp.]|nr:MAG: diguanylate cyclase response regulator [Kangiella sp.]